MNSGHNSKADFWIDCNFDSSEISIILNFSQLKNAFSHIFVKFDGIKIVSIFEFENANFSIVCKLELVGIATLLSLEQ